MKIKNRYTGKVILTVEKNEDGIYNLRWANLEGADLRWANLEAANLQEANLQEANLQVAGLRMANLQVADLRWANLRMANLRWANLYGANLQEANLQEANLEGAKNIISIGPIGEKLRIIYVVKDADCVMVQAGYFWGNITEFKSAVDKKYNGVGLYYQAISLIEAWYDKS